MKGQDVPTIFLAESVMPYASARLLVAYHSPCERVMLLKTTAQPRAEVMPCVTTRCQASVL